MAIAQVGTTKTATAAAGGTATTAAIDTTGATLLLATTAGFSHNETTDTVSCSKGNTWRALTNYASGSSNITIWYSYDHSGSALSVGSGHTFSAAGSYIGLVFSAWSGTDTTSAVLGNTTGAGGSSGTTLQPGSINSTSGNLLITGLGHRASSGSTSINGSFSILAILNFAAGANMGSGQAYKISTGSAENPTWTETIAWADASAIIAEFKVGSGVTTSLFLTSKLAGIGVGGPFFRNPVT